MAMFRVLVLSAVGWVASGAAQAEAQDAVAIQALRDVCLPYVAYGGSRAEAVALARAASFVSVTPTSEGNDDMETAGGLYRLGLASYEVTGGARVEYRKVCKFVSRSSAVPEAQTRLAVQSEMSVTRSFSPVKPWYQNDFAWAGNGIDPGSGQYIGQSGCATQSTRVEYDDGKPAGMAPSFLVQSSLLGCTAPP